MDLIELRSRVYRRFHSMAEFAKAMGWDASKVRRIMAGQQQPDVGEILQMAEALGVESAEDFMLIFFGKEALRALKAQ